MQFIKSTLLAGAAALALASAAHAAETHVMTVQLPDGGVARIAYQGDIPPQVIVAPSFPMLPAFAPSFAALDQMTAALDREADAMLRTAALMQGIQVFSTTETFTTNGACIRRTEITYTSDGAAPRAISSQSGDCAVPSPQRIHAPAPRHRPDLVLARAGGAKPYAGLVKDAVYRVQ
jgi:hypothetical protein